MTDTEIHNYLYQLCFLTDSYDGNKNVVGWNAKDFWHQLKNNVYNKYGTRPINPVHICETLNPFTIHFTWDTKNDLLGRNVLGCAIKETKEIYVCFNNSQQNWKEFLYLPKIQLSERLMETFYLYFLECL